MILVLLAAFSIIIFLKLTVKKTLKYCNPRPTKMSDAETEPGSDLETEMETETASQRSKITERKKPKKSGPDTVKTTLTIRDQALCDTIIEALDKRLDAKIKVMTTVLENRFERMEMRITELERELKIIKETRSAQNVPNLQPESPSAGPSSLTTTIRDEMYEQRRRELKKPNIIVYGLAEEIDGNMEKQKVDSLIQNCDSTSRPKTFRRLGKPGTRPRPLLITFDSVYMKKGIMTGKAKLRSMPQYRDVFIAHDLTVIQRQERKIFMDKKRAAEVRRTEQQ